MEVLQEMDVQMIRQATARLLLVGLALALAGAAFACDDSVHSVSTPPRQVAVQELTLEEVWERALAALSRPGQVYHSTETKQIEGHTFVSEVWLDLERDLARVQSRYGPRIYHEGKITELSPDGRFQQSGGQVRWLDKSSVRSLRYITTLRRALFFPEVIESTELRESEVDGLPAILVEVVWPYTLCSASGTATEKVYLDESFLPLRIDHDDDRRGGPDKDWSMVIENEFVDRDSLPEDLFSPEVVRALAVTPADDIARAVKAGLPAYWLGERFEDMVLEEAYVMEHHWESEGVRSLHITYRGREPGPASPGFGVTISEYTTDDWDHQRAALQRTPWWEEPGTIRTPVAVLGTEATLYQSLNTGPAGRPPSQLLLVRLDKTVLKIQPNVGDWQINPYRDNVDALLRLANSMRPFERRPE